MNDRQSPGSPTGRCSAAARILLLIAAARCVLIGPGRAAARRSASTTRRATVTAHGRLRHRHHGAAARPDRRHRRDRPGDRRRLDHLPAGQADLPAGHRSDQVPGRAPRCSRCSPPCPTFIAGLILVGNEPAIAVGFAVGALVAGIAYGAVFLLLGVLTRHAVVDRPHLRAGLGGAWSAASSPAPGRSASSSGPSRSPTSSPSSPFFADRDHAQLRRTGPAHRDHRRGLLGGPAPAQLLPHRRRITTGTNNRLRVRRVTTVHDSSGYGVSRARSCPVRRRRRGRRPRGARRPRWPGPSRRPPP